MMGTRAAAFLVYVLFQALLIGGAWAHDECAGGSRSVRFWVGLGASLVNRTTNTSCTHQFIGNLTRYHTAVSSLGIESWHLKSGPAAVLNDGSVHDPGLAACVAQIRASFPRIKIGLCGSTTADALATAAADPSKYVDALSTFVGGVGFEVDEIWTDMEIKDYVNTKGVNEMHALSQQRWSTFRYAGCEPRDRPYFGENCSSFVEGAPGVMVQAANTYWSTTISGGFYKGFGNLLEQEIANIGPHHIHALSPAICPACPSGDNADNSLTQEQLDERMDLVCSHGIRDVSAFTFFEIVNLHNGLGDRYMRALSYFRTGSKEPSSPTSARAAAERPRHTAGGQRVSLSQLPLRTHSRWIVDKQGRRVKWSCVNWSGAAQKDGVPGGLQHQPVAAIANTFASMGFNCIRLPWSVAMVQNPHPVTNRSLLGANPQLVGSNTLDILDAVVKACADARLMVILDNHMSDPDWCCSLTDQNGLWYNDRYSESEWIDSHVTLALRYAHEPFVVGSELRNELRASVVGGSNIEPTWGTGNRSSDWLAAAERAAAAILKERSEGLLVVLDSLDYSTNFRGARLQPPSLPVSGRLVYSAHDYSWSQPLQSEQDLHQLLTQQWGFLITPNQNFTAPVWVSEFGTWHDGHDMQSGWWPWFISYLQTHDLDFGYWRGDGTESRGTGRTFGAEAGFGVLNQDWNATAAGGVLLKALQPLQAPTLGPGIDRPLVPW